jgi:hypothetical protein
VTIAILAVASVSYSLVQSMVNPVGLATIAAAVIACLQSTDHG